MQKHCVIAIDGPAGAGKTTMAKRLADELGIHILDTGALFRALALCALRQGVDLDRHEEVQQAVKDAKVTIEVDQTGQRTFLNGEDVSQAIRTPEAGAGASAIGTIGQVRHVLTQQVRRIASELSVVVDGRDVGTAMLPDADVKFYLTAQPAERAERRRKEQEQKGVHEPFETVLAGIQQRDYNDSHRAIAPLKRAEDAVVIDSTHDTPEQVLKKMIEIVEEKLK